MYTEFYGKENPTAQESHFGAALTLNNTRVIILIGVSLGGTTLPFHFLSTPAYITSVKQKRKIN